MSGEISKLNHNHCHLYQMPQFGLISRTFVNGETVSTLSTQCSRPFGYGGSPLGYYILRVT